MSQFKVALIQPTSTDDVSANIAMLQQMMDAAMQKSPAVILLPENAFYMRREGTHAGEVHMMQAHPGVIFCQDYAKQHHVHILIGSIRACPETGGDKSYNRSVWVDNTGEILGYYDKIHLFDVDLPNGKTYRESSQFLAGNRLSLLEVRGIGKIGLSICYDLRFPGLYRALSLKGADMLTVPSAFTRETGKAHWEILLRARAIENAAFVFAPAQCGEHPGGRTTYGHSMVVDPWGNVIVQAGEVPEVLVVNIDPGLVQKTRTQIPVLQHHREWA